MSKVLLVTGGARGIGAATARLAARHGWDVAVNYVGRRDAAEAVVADVVAAGRRAIAVQADVAEPAAVERMFTTVDEKLGRLDGFFNNAGILGPHTRFVELPLAQVERTLAINLLGAFVCAQAAVRRMSKRHGGNGGAIVNMSSMASKLGGAFECLDYGVSKGGIDTMTIGLAKELAGDGIRVNGVRPGLIRTDIQLSTGEPDRVGRLEASIPLGRGGEPQDVAEAVVWLLSEQASYITGVTIDVAGGRGL